jgi:L-rhamnose mutarotase
MLDALSEAGWRDYSLFLRENGLLVGHLVTEDFEAARSGMAATEVNRRWQAEIAPFFIGLESGRPDTDAHPLEEMFHME